MLFLDVAVRPIIWEGLDGLVEESVPFLECKNKLTVSMVVLIGVRIIPSSQSGFTYFRHPHAVSRRRLIGEQRLEQDVLFLFGTVFPRRS